MDDTATAFRQLAEATGAIADKLEQQPAPPPIPVPPGTDLADYGAVLLDSFAGTTDEEKLTAALSAIAADTFPRAVQLTNRRYDFTTGNRAAFNGMKIMGPRGFNIPEQNSQTKMPGRVHLSMAGPWFHNGGATVFGVTLANLSFTGGSGATVLGQSGGGSFRCLQMSDIGATGLKSVCGTLSARLLLTACTFDGAWDVSGFYNTPFHLGGSDNTLWTDGMILTGNTDFLTAGKANGQYTLWFEGMGKSYIGPLYITAEGGWGGIRVQGPEFNTGATYGGQLAFYGLKIEGKNKSRPCFGALLRVDGGTVVLRDSALAYAMSNPAGAGHPVDAGVIHHSAGTLLVDGCSYDRATGVAETVPFVYTAAAGDCVVRGIQREQIGGNWTGRPRVAKAAGTAENRITDATVTLV